jgi:endonuclease/exonuclease/phosphatase family metal-dependent hydrolase
MEQIITGVKNTKNTFCFALLLLFFFQIFGMWIESIYRISLIHLGPGKELFGILLLLLALFVFAVKEKYERPFLWVVLLIFIMCRLVCPQGDVVARIVLGGVGVSMFLIILSYVFSGRYNALKGDLGQALGLAVLLSVALRSWGSSMDVSLEGSPSVLAIIMALLAVFQFRYAMAVLPDTPPESAQSPLRGTFALLGLFANFTLVYLVFSCPLVVCAWTGYTELAWSGITAVGAVAISFAVGSFWIQHMAAPRPFLAGLWNLSLILLLLGGLLVCRTLFPTSPESSAVFVDGAARQGSMLLYLALLFSAVVMVNVRHIAGVSFFRRPRNAVLPILMGTSLLIALTFLLIMTNVWGYVPLGQIFRNRFYLPFLFAGIIMLAPWMILKPKDSITVTAPGSLLKGMVVFIAVLAVIGAFVHSLHSKPDQAKGNLTIMTYNMQQGSHDNGNQNYREQLDLLRKINPDIIGLQESDTARPSGGHVDAVRYFAESLGYHAYYGPGTVTGTFGSAILSRYPIKNPRTFFTYSDPDEVGTAAAEIEVGDRTIAFFSNHPAGGAEVMNPHVDALLAEAGKYEHVIAAGDFNFTAREPFYKRLSEQMQNSAAQVGEANINYHGGVPDLADEIDHIFLSPDFRVLESHYLPPPDSQTDHPAHWSVVQLPSEISDDNGKRDAR